MKALTIWQPWASLIAMGIKTVEWRGWPAPRWVVGQRLVIHAGMTDPRGHVRDLLVSEARLRGSLGPQADIAKAREALQQWSGRPFLLPRGAGLCTVVLGQPKRADLLGFTVPAGSAPNFAWPLEELVAWDEPVDCRGAQGFWNWPLPLDGARPA